MVQNEIKIAVIIPHYYNSQISKRAFDSLKYQTKKEHLVIYLINDCSPHTDCNYQDLIDEYSPYFSIQYFQTEINSGQGITRQLGLNNVIEDSRKGAETTTINHIIKAYEDYYQLKLLKS